MSQMKPYCFKCGAELEPEAIYCPECGRLQRSMVVRSVDPNDQGAPPAPYSGSSHEQPYQLYPDRDAAAAEHQGPAEQHPDAAPQHPDQHDPYAQQHPEQDWRGGQHDAYGAQAPYTPTPPGGDQVYAQHDHDQQQPYGDQWTDSYQQGEAGQGHEASGYNGHDPYAQHEQGHDQQDQGYAQQDQGYAQQDQGYARQDQSYGQHDQGYGQQDQAYGQQDQGYGQHEQGYAQQDPAYGQHDPAYGQQHQAHGQNDAAYDQHYAQPEEPAAAEAEPEPPSWQRRTDPYTPSSPPPPIYQRAAAPVPPVPPVPAPPAPAQPPAEPMYRSAAPIPAGSRLEPFNVPPPPSGGYGPDTAAQPGPGRYGLQPTSNPYALATYDNDAAYGQPSSRSPIRLIAIGGAILLGLFLIAFVAGQILGSRSGNNPSAATGPPTAQPTNASTNQPTSAPTATAAPTATPGQGITGNAKFVRVSSTITGRCTTTTGCPASGTFKNTGEQGSGSVTFNITDQGGTTTYATCTTPIPATDAGQTATASCNASGDALSQLFHSNPGATIYLQTQINSS